MQSIEEVQCQSGMIQQLRNTLVGQESPELLRKFEERRKELEARLASGETQSATIREARRIGRNDPCPCGSGTKFKKCCGSRLPENDERIKQ